MIISFFFEDSLAFWAPYYMFVDLRNKLTHAPLTLQMCTHTHTTPTLTHTWYIIRPMEISRNTDGVHGNVTTVVKSSGDSTIYDYGKVCRDGKGSSMCYGSRVPKH